MAKNQNNKDYGQQFESSVKQALNNGDFSNLNKLIKDTVKASVSDAVSQVRDSVYDATEQVINATGDAIKKGINGAASNVNIKNTTNTTENTNNFNNANNNEKPDIETSYSEIKGAYTYQKNDSNTNNFKSNDFSANSQNKKRGSKLIDEGLAYNVGEIFKNVNINTGFSKNLSSKRLKKESADNQQFEVQNRPILFKKIGSVSGTLLQIFGWIGVGVFGLVLIILMIVTIFQSYTPRGMYVADSLFTVFTLCSAIMLGYGNKIKGRLMRSERYLKLCERTGYRNISELASSVGKKEIFVLKELKELLTRGAYLQGHLDDEEKCFMITDEAYKQYNSIMIERANLDNERVLEDNEEEAEELTEQQRALKKMVAEGREYIFQIRQKNDAISGEIISEKLYRMEALLKEIFINLEKKPSQMPKMYKLMNYYLPTTLKLVTAYEEFDNMSVQGEDVVTAKKEIENTIDTINDAFGELLNKLFTDTAMDVTTDAQVLKTILAREGLTKDSMSKEENEYVYELR